MNRLSSKMHVTLTSDVIRRLNAKQVYTVLDFVRSDTKVIEKATQLTFREILDVRKELIKKFSAIQRNAFEFSRDILSNSALIETGVKKLDILLDGGLFTGNIYEICGLPATGKTLFCLTIVKNVITNLKENIYYLDTKQDFCARKLKLMLNLNQGELVDVLKRCLIKRITSQHELLCSLFEIKDMVQSGLKLRMIIIDSLPAVCWQSTDHLRNNCFLSHAVNVLHYLSVEHNIVIVITNAITQWNESGFNSQHTYQERISCGGYWYNVPNVRLKFEKVIENCCRVTLMKTWKVMPEIHDCDVELSNFGIR